MDYKTSESAKTSFPMKASLGKLEQELLQRWEQEQILPAAAAKYADRPKYILHDGPPHANGHLHLGHASIRSSKTLSRVKSMEGTTPSTFRAGIVAAADRAPGRPRTRRQKAGMSKADIRRRCRAFAERFIDIQREEFKRMGVVADWEHLI
jgi:isoleucyl-tRNA synthetase